MRHDDLVAPASTQKAMIAASERSTNESTVAAAQRAEEERLSGTNAAPTDFVPAPDGGLDYGEITPEMGKAMGR